MSKIYLDNASSTPLRKEVTREISACLSFFGNPSSTHFFGRKMRALIETARESIAQNLGASSGEIIFTSCATEANYFILFSSVWSLNIKQIISSPIEHPSIIETLKTLERDQKIKIKWLSPNKKAEIDLEELSNLLKEKALPTLVSLTYANNETGNLIDAKALSALCKKHGAYLHLDAVQWVGHYPLDLSRGEIDFLSASAHKFYGPMGVGFCFISKKVKLRSLLKGGAQEGGLRAGGENVLGIIAMAKALEVCLKNLEEEKKYIEELKSYTISKLKKELPAIEFNGNCLDFEKSLYTLLSLKIPSKNEFLAFELENQGIMVSRGSACSAGSGKISHVMKYLYKMNDESLFSFLRISFGIFNKKEEIDKFVEALGKCIF